MISQAADTTDYSNDNFMLLFDLNRSALAQATDKLEYFTKPHEHSRFFTDVGHGILGCHTEEDIVTTNNLLDVEYSSTAKRHRIKRGKQNNVQIGVVEWDKECEQYYDIFYKGLPYPYVFNRYENESEFNDLVESIKGIGICKYNIIDHFKFLGYYGLIEHLPGIEKINFEALNLLYDPALNVLYFLYCSTATSLINLTLDMELCTKAIMLFSILHKDMLRNSGLVLISNVIVKSGYEYLINGVQSHCSCCSKYLISKKIFSEQLKEHKQDINKINLNLLNDNINDTEKFRKHLCKIFTFMAGYASSSVPNLSLDVAEQIDQMTVLLTPHQLGISKFLNKHMLVTGPYGSAKSDIGRLQLKELAKKSKHDKIYYVNCGGSKALLKDMEVYANELNTRYNSSIQCVDLADADVHLTLRSVFKRVIMRSQGEKIHIILDQLALHDFSVNDINDVLEITETYQEFKNSAVTVILQSMSLEDLSSHKSKLDCFLLDNKFEHVSLKKSVYTTISNNKVVNTVIDVLNGKSIGFTSKFYKRQRRNGETPQRFYFHYFSKNDSMHGVNGVKPILITGLSPHGFGIRIYQIMLCLKMLKDRDIINYIEESVLTYLQLSDLAITESALSLFHAKERDEGNLDQLKLTIQNSSASSGAKYKTGIVHADIRKQENICYLGEALSRSKYSVIMLTGIPDSDDSLSQIVRRWIEENVVEVIDITTLDGFTIDEDGVRSEIKDHLKSKLQLT